MAALGVLCAAALVAISIQRKSEGEAFHEVSRSPSFLAVGDIGKVGLFKGRGKRAVAAAIDWLDHREPAEGLLLLGDNFYPSGLVETDLEEKVRRCIAEPFAGFAHVSTQWRTYHPSSRERHPFSEARARPIWAVLGNHDHKSANSPYLQKHVVPRLIENWTMPEGLVGVYTIREGISLILYDSTALIEASEQDLDTLTEAIRSSPGPWRILASHHPLVGYRATPRILRAIGRAATVVQLAIAGHEHNLQAIERSGPNRGLQIVSGSGSNVRPVEGDVAGRLFTSESLGFVQVELTGSQTDPRLMVTLFEVPRLHLPWTPPIRKGAAFAVDLQGKVTPARPAPLG